MDIACKLGLPIQEAIETHTSSEFVDWDVYLEMVEWEERTKTDFYFAALMATIAAAFSSEEQGKQIEVNDFLLKFARVNPENGNPSDRELQSSLEVEKSLIAAMINRGKKQNSATAERKRRDEERRKTNPKMPLLSEKIRAKRAKGKKQ